MFFKKALLKIYRKFTGRYRKGPAAWNGLRVWCEVLIINWVFVCKEWLLKLLDDHCVTSVGIWSFFGPNAGKYGPKNSEYGHFSCWLYYTFMGLIRSELYSFRIRIQKIVFYCLYRSITNYINYTNYRRKTFTVCHLYPRNHLSVIMVLLNLLLWQYLSIVAVRNNIITLVTHTIILGKI